MRQASIDGNKINLKYQGHVLEILLLIEVSASSVFFLIAFSDSWIA